MTQDTIYIKLFGEFSVWVNGQPVPLDNCTTKAMRVLQFLLFRYPAGVSRNTLMDAFFVDDSTSDPANNLNVTISQLRRRLKKAALPGEVGVQLKSNQYTLTCSVPIHSDVTRFEECMAQAGQTTNADQRLELLLEAEQLYSGDFLPHLAMDDWAVTTAAKYRMDYFACLDALTQLLPERGEWEQLLGIATRASAMHPLEEFFCLRIDCLMNLERYQEAKQVYDQAIRTLTEDFVVKPSAELTRRFQLLSLANQDSHETIFELNNQLREAEHQRGAYYCSYPSFIDVYRMCCRMIERTGQSACLLLYWLVDPKGHALTDTDKIAQAAPLLSGAIHDSLRRGDAFTQHGRDRFLVLLIGTDRENCEIVDQRIQARYKQQPVRGVALRHSLQTVETDMPFPNSGIWQPQ